MPSGKAAITRRAFFVPDMGPGNNDTVGKKIMVSALWS